MAGRKGQTTISFYLPVELKARIDAACLGPYQLTVTSIMQRGIELALAEIDDLKMTQERFKTTGG